MNILPFVFKHRLKFIGGTLFLSATLISWVIFDYIHARDMVAAAPTPTPSILDDRAIPDAPVDLTIPEPTAPNKDLKNANSLGILILGYGGPGHQGGFLTDVILFANVDFVKQKLTLIHIPRDIWIQLPSGSSFISAKINAALPMGLKIGNYPTQDVAKDTIVRGSYLTRLAVNQVTGLDTDLVIAIDFTRFSQAINALRGIDVNVLKPLQDSWYPITGRELELCGKTPEEVTELSNTLSGFELEKQFPCRYETLDFQPGVNHMDGDTVLKFVRSRHTTSDFDRGERQIQVLLAVMDKLFSLKALDNIPEFYSTLGKAVKTDITLELITQISPKLLSLPQFTVTKFSLSTANVLSSIKTTTGASALIPKAGENNWRAIHQYVSP